MIDGVIAALSILLAAVALVLIVDRSGNRPAMAKTEVARQCGCTGWSARFVTKANGEHVIVCNGTENTP